MQQRSTVASVTSLPRLLLHATLASAAYLSVSGVFHIAVGVLHLFGYDLPETNRYFLLAHSPLDIWRRTNIYFKDFGLKVFYQPTYFKLRKRSERGAHYTALVVVFTASWLLHVWDFAWLRNTTGSFRAYFDATMLLYWALFGITCFFNLRRELGAKKSPPAAKGSWGARLRLALAIAGTFLLNALLWTLYQSRSISEWIDLLRWWR
jgi:hypothetical protein